MKVIIEHNKTKRKIEGPFNICGSRQDLERIANTINEVFKDGTVYGWVKIHDEYDSIPNTEPIGWE